MQYEERVSVISGKAPVIFVAPHCEDINTGFIAKNCAEILHGYAVINNTWQRSKTVDQKNEKANCNSIRHCHEYVVKEEFLDPIVRFKNNILKKYANAYVFLLHGVGDQVKKTVNDEELGYIIGYGYPNSLSCETWVKDCFIYMLFAADTCNVYEGHKKFAGNSKDNMNQFFALEYKVQSIQIEIVHSLRSSVLKADVTAQIIAMCVEELLERSHFDPPSLLTSYTI